MMNNTENDKELLCILSTVSHELRAPIASIKSHLSAVSDGTLSCDEQKKYLDIAESEADRAIALLEGIMSLARIGSGAVKPRLEGFDINELCRLAVIERVSDIEQKEMEVITEFEHEKDLVFADRSMLLQVLTNLVDNAVKYGRIGGFIKLNTKTDADSVIISVSDNGIGIESDVLPHIWDKFYQKEHSSVKYSGNGLGLPLVKDILRLHNSDINVSSAPGVGTEFSFRLPSKK